MGVKYSSSTAVAQLQLSQFLAALFFFHGSEYVLAAAFHGRHNVSLSSLLISKQYVVAMACALVEYFIEYSFFPELKNNRLVSNIGLFLVLLGEVIRKTAILTARKSFTHNIRIRYEDQHVLITHGIYRFMRHPSYCGFFIWAIGTQVMICNRFCIVAFAVVIWQFFYKRIPVFLEAVLWVLLCGICTPCSFRSTFHKMTPRTFVRWLNLKEFCWSLQYLRRLLKEVHETIYIGLFHGMHCLYIVMESIKYTNQRILVSNRLSFAL
ncbi:putative protein-S-isoprenylcysteine O-methyltransferase [Iris pallida]|uniref:Protein-S-isoprenylcysteine O-methyltransferase n=1 Tax=Iris pallida TaxID=29817 RepID=A0AAX6DVZ1_IRIPA|nr:putative protein-S-isoprenylcysteine O-methyltransferase [Iris pallida]